MDIETAIAWLAYVAREDEQAMWDKTVRQDMPEELLQWLVWYAERLAANPKIDRLQTAINPSYDPQAVETIAKAAKVDGALLARKFAEAGVPRAIVHGLAQSFAENPRFKLLEPPERASYQEKPLTFLCQCGCGETVPYLYTTGRKPRYKNASHRQRAWRKRVREREGL
jgi:hypothetical protein